MKADEKNWRRDEVTMARLGLLDALKALKPHLDALVIIGAQAVYLHTGAMKIALAEFTTDGDVAVDPDVLSADPLVEVAMAAAGFIPDPRPSAIGSWISPRGVPVDLMVPDAEAGAGRRGVRVPPHDTKSMRRARGIEAALIDNSKMIMRARPSGRCSENRDLGRRSGRVAGGQGAQDPQPARVAFEGDPVAVSESVTLLAQDLLSARAPEGS